jgi:hypothetical protein
MGPAKGSHAFAQEVAGVALTLNGELTDIAQPVETEGKGIAHPYRRAVGALAGELEECGGDIAFG